MTRTRSRTKVVRGEASLPSLSLLPLLLVLISPTPSHQQVISSSWSLTEQQQQQQQESNQEDGLNQQQQSQPFEGPSNQNQRRSSYLYKSNPSYIPRVSCPNNDVSNTFTSYIGLTIEGGKLQKPPHVLEKELQKVHRAGTAIQCDPQQRSLSQVTFLQSDPSLRYKDASMALFQVTVNSYSTNNNQQTTALEPPHPDVIRLPTIQKTGDTCHISELVKQQDENQPDHDQDKDMKHYDQNGLYEFYSVAEEWHCPFDGCYCDAKPGTPVSGVTTEQLVHLYDKLDLSPPPKTKAPKSKGKGKGGKRHAIRLLSKGKGAKKYPKAAKSTGKGTARKGYDRYDGNDNDYDHGGYEYNSYDGDYTHYYGKKKSYTPPLSNVIDAIELNQFNCASAARAAGDGGFSVNDDNAFMFEFDVNPCLVLTEDEQKEFTRLLVKRYNLFQFNNCDPAFRRLLDAEIINCKDVFFIDADGNVQRAGRRQRRATVAGRQEENLHPIAHQVQQQLNLAETSHRNLQFSNKFQNSFIVNFTLFTDLEQKDEALEQFSGDVRHRHRRELQNVPKELARHKQRDLQSAVAMSRRQLTSYVESEIDYGVFNGQDGKCYCSAFYPGGGTGRGITEAEFQQMADDIIDEVTGGRAQVEDVEEVNVQECGGPQVFTQTLSVIANPEGASGQALEDLGVVIGELLDRMALDYCVSSYFQIVDVTLVFSELRKDSKSGNNAWALLYEIQYVAFGVTGKDAELFRVVKIDNRSYGKKQYRDEDDEDIYDDHRRRRLEEVEQGVASFRASAEHGARLAARRAPHVDEDFLLTISQDHHHLFQSRGETARQNVNHYAPQQPFDFSRQLQRKKKQDADAVLLSTICVCSLEIIKSLDKLPLLLVNKKLNERICDDNAVSGIDFAIIMH